MDLLFPNRQGGYLIGSDFRVHCQKHKFAFSYVSMLVFSSARNVDERTWACSIVLPGDMYRHRP